MDGGPQRRHVQQGSQESASRVLVVFLVVTIDCVRLLYLTKMMDLSKLIPVTFEFWTF